MYSKKIFYSVAQFTHGQALPKLMWFESLEDAKEYNRTHDLSESPVTHTYRTDESIYEIEQLIKKQDMVQDQSGINPIGPYYNEAVLGMRNLAKR